MVLCEHLPQLVEKTLQEQTTAVSFEQLVDIVQDEVLEEEEGSNGWPLQQSFKQQVVNRKEMRVEVRVVDNLIAEL